MSFSFFRRSSFRFRPQLDPAVGRDADELMHLWGAAAYGRAIDLSSQEALGRISSARPGHWRDVRREIGRRIGYKDAELQPEVAA
jgi:hypothetical protein